MIVADTVWWEGRLQTGLALRADGSGVLPVDEIPVGSQWRRVPGTVMPGLVDAHVHSGLGDLAVVRAHGISAVWDLGSTPAAVRALRDRPDLPRIRYAGPFMTAPGGYPSDRAWAPPGSCREIRSAADAEAAVGEAEAGGATLIKVTANADGPVLAASTLETLVDAAHGRGLPVVVHAEGPGMVAAAYAAVADLLAHTPWTEAVDDGLIRACAARMTWISTLDIHGWASRTPPPARAVAIDNLRRFRAAGGIVRYGTDLGNGPLPAGINRREVRALQAVGLTPAEILTAMTGSDQADPAWLPDGLELDPARFAAVLATARVLGPELRPRP